jgi:hypothetical protein
MSLELVSIHIPKTAGHSFKGVLTSVFGKENILHANALQGYFRIIGGDILLMGIDTLEKICNNYKVIHGHFTFRDIETIYDNFRPLLFAWVRDPVERVVSYYNYLLRKKLIEKKFVIGFEDEPDLVDYARKKNARNVMSRCLEGIDLEEIDFLGVFEYIQEEIEHLSNMMSWGRVTLEHKNKSEVIRKKRPPVSEEEKRIIRDLNEEDVEIYERALILREKRLKEFKKKSHLIEKKISSFSASFADGTDKDIPIDPVSIFLHIPKTGGMTLYDIIKKNVREDSTFTIPANGEDLFRNLPPEERQRYRCIMGHAMFGIHEYISNPFYYLTFLRNPVDRLVSQYYHALGAEGNGLSKMIKENRMSCEDFLMGDMNVVYNHQTRMIAGRAVIRRLSKKYRGLLKDKSIRFAIPELLSKAKQNIRNFFRFVGIVERYDESLLIMAKKTGFKNIYYTKINVTRKKPAKILLSDEIRESVYEKNKLDLELYRFVNELLDREIKAYGITFKKDLNNFRFNNRLRGAIKKIQFSFRQVLR